MYLYVDSFEGLSRDEILQRTFDERLSHEIQAKAIQIAEERGLTVMELLREMAEYYDVMMADPVKREEWLQKSQEIDDKMAMPFGPDPLLAGDGDRDDDEEES